MKEQSNRKGTAILVVYALALGLALSLTGGMHYRGIWSGAEQNYIELGLAAILKGIGMAVPAFIAVYALNRWLVPFLSARMVPGERKIPDRVLFSLCLAVLLICRLPYLLSFFPGGVVGDAAETLEFAIRTEAINSRWGVAQILVFRLFLALGRLFSPDVNIGIFLYSLCSCLLYSAACAAVIVTLRKKGFPSLLLILFLFIYAFFGHYASYSISLWKDSLFSAGIVAFSLLLWTEPKEGEPCRAWTVKTGIVLLFLCFWRNFVSYGLLAAGILLLIIARKKKRVLSLLMILVSLLMILVQGPVYRAFGIRGQTSTEMLAVPLQQVAAVVHEGAELNEEQAVVLDRILPLDRWSELYTPSISDSIKFQLDDAWLQEHTAEFLKVWLQLSIRRPGAYARAYLMETAGFWQPYGSNKGSYYDWFVGVQDLYGRGYQERDLIFEATGYSLKNSLKNRLPFIPSGMMVWVMLLSLAFLLCRNKGHRRGIAVLLPYLCTWIAVMLSTPIAYSYRYVEMLAVGLPVLICLPIVREENGTGRPVREPAEERRSRTIARTAVILAAGILMSAFLSGIAGRTGLSAGKLEIYTFGERDNADLYISEGISSAEEGFRWTEGDRLIIGFPCRGAEREVEVAIHVRGTFNGIQRYTIRDSEDNEILAGEISGTGVIRFEMTAGEPETSFTMELPDAMKVSDVSTDSRDYRKIAMQISGIEITDISEASN